MCSQTRILIILPSLSVLIQRNPERKWRTEVLESKVPVCSEFHQECTKAEEVTCQWVFTT
uniref:Uncharacterized protein n=1 Tax=Anguilla anguilla TaxID=7936 RepID=A0A0E9XXE5_ANGAN